MHVATECAEEIFPLTVVVEFFLNYVDLLWPSFQGRGGWYLIQHCHLPLDS